MQVNHIQIEVTTICCNEKERQNNQIHLIRSCYNQEQHFHQNYLQSVFPGGEFERLRLMLFSLSTANHQLAR